MFTKLKSKVRRETCANERIYTTHDRGKHGAEFRSADSSTLMGEPKENQRYGSIDTQPLTLSPIASHQATFEYSSSGVGSKPAEMLSPRGGRGHGREPRKEAAEAFQPHCPVSRKQVQAFPIGDVGGFRVADESLVNTQPLGAPASVFTPIRNRLRKRKWDLTIVSGRMKEGGRDVTCQPQERRTSTPFGLDDNHNNTCVEGALHVGGVSAGHAEVNHFPPPPSAAKKREIRLFSVPQQHPCLLSSSADLSFLV